MIPFTNQATSEALKELGLPQIRGSYYWEKGSKRIWHYTDFDFNDESMENLARSFSAEELMEWMQNLVPIPKVMLECSTCHSCITMWQAMADATQVETGKYWESDVVDNPAEAVAQLILRKDAK